MIDVLSQNGFRFPAKSLVEFFATLRPELYDGPQFGRGDPLGGFSRASALRAVEDELNPQPLPPRWRYAVLLSDSYINELLTLDRIGRLVGGEAAERTAEEALRLIADVDELCPRWPHPVWPWPPHPRSLKDEEMDPVDLLVFGSQVLAASGLMRDRSISSALTALGEKMTSLSAQGE